MGTRRPSHRFRVVPERLTADLFDASGWNQSSTTHKHRTEHRTGMVRIPQVRRESVMILSRFRKGGLILLFASMTVAAACKGKQPPPPPAAVVTPPPAPAPPAPTITLRAEPATIERGASVTLNWEARNAATVT